MKNHAFRCQNTYCQITYENIGPLHEMFQWCHVVQKVMVLHRKFRAKNLAAPLPPKSIFAANSLRIGLRWSVQIIVLTFIQVKDIQIINVS